MKLFVLSLPYDQENSGDYNYCSLLVQTLQSQTDVSAEYITGKTLDFDSRIIKHLDVVAVVKNTGDSKFYAALEEYYNLLERKEAVKKLTERPLVSSVKSDKAHISISIRISRQLLLATAT